MAPIKANKALIARLTGPRFATRKALFIAGLKQRYNASTMNAIPAQWERFVRYLGKIPGQVGRVTYGLIYNKGKNTDGFEYLSGVEVAGCSGLPREFSCVNIPAYKYAVFPHCEHVSKLKETMDAISDKQLPGVMAPGIDDVPGAIERYGEGFNPQTGIGDIEVWVPINV
jgi:AraC family transcriptional regulator